MNNKYIINYMDKNIHNQLYNEPEDDINIDTDTDITLSDEIQKEFNDIVNRKLSKETKNVEKKEEIKNIDNTKDKKICGYKNFKKELEKLNIDMVNNETTDSFDESSVYSYETVDEKDRIYDPIFGRIDKFEISYPYVISVVISLFLLYYFYRGNIFITIIEFILLFAFPYIYIVLKLYISSKEIVRQLKLIKLN